MKAAVIRFPGSNCDQDCYHVLSHDFGLDTEYVWHKEASVEQFDLIVLPGGFSRMGIIYGAERLPAFRR